MRLDDNLLLFLENAHCKKYSTDRGSFIIFKYNLKRV